MSKLVRVLIYGIDFQDETVTLKLNYEIEFIVNVKSLFLKCQDKSASLVYSDGISIDFENVNQYKTQSLLWEDLYS
jgi:hypothetical protein